MKTLIVAEKPSVAKDIAAALGDDFTKTGGATPYLERDDLIISSAIGHLVELECPADEDPGYRLDRLPAIPGQFALAAKPKTRSQLALLERLMARRDVEAVVNACDAGREGELIFRYIAFYCDCRKPMYRMWLQSMTQTAILNAMGDMEPAQLRDNLFYAAQSRSEADWLIGVNATRAVSILHKAQANGQRDKLTVGRVQTPTLNLIVARELAIKNFVAKDYFEVHAEFGSGAQRYVGKWIDPRFVANPAVPDAKADRFFDRSQAEATAARCRGAHPSSVSDVATDERTLPPKLFDLTTLQREASKRLGFTASNTLALAQSLYQNHKALTYPRTDATALPEDYIDTAQATLVRLSQSGHSIAPFAATAVDAVRPDKRIFNDAKISDHFAIIPTGQGGQSFTADEARLYDLVVRRFVAVFFPPALHQQTVRTTMLQGEQFRSTGRVLIEEGWMAVYGADAPADGQEDTSQLCPLAAGQILPTTSIRVVGLKTRAPAHFTEDTLLAAMESAGNVIDDEDLREAMKERGLGTPATRAPTIEHLLDPEVGYLVRQKKNLLPTQKGFDLIAFLQANGLGALTAAQTTGEWEFALRKMEQGAYTRDAFMAGIQKMAHTIVDRVRTCVAALPPELQRHAAAPVDTAIACPRCRTATLQADASAYTCACGFKLWKTLAGLTLTDEQAHVLLTTGQHPVLSGFKSSKKPPKPFSAALRLAGDLSGKVEFVFEDRPAAAALPPPADGGGGDDAFPCPACSKPLRQRQHAGKPFWGCSGYPGCKKTVPDHEGRPKLP